MYVNNAQISLKKKNNRTEHKEYRTNLTNVLYYVLILNSSPGYETLNVR